MHIARISSDRAKIMTENLLMTENKFLGDSKPKLLSANRDRVVIFTWQAGLKCKRSLETSLVEPRNAYSAEVLVKQILAVLYF